MNTLAPSFLIGSTSFLQVTRTCMKAWLSSNFGQIPPPTPELSALARLKNCCEHSSAYIFDWILFIFSGNEDTQQVWTEFEFWPGRTKWCRVTEPLINVRNWFLLNILRMDGQNLTKFCIHIIIDKIYVATVKRHFSQICNGVTALDWCQKLVFAQYLENGWTEFNQSLYTHYHRQDLYWYYKASFLANVQQSYGPLLMSEIGFCSIYLENGWT